MRAAIKELDPALALYAVRTYDDAVGSSVAQRRVTASVLALFAIFGLALGVVGVYGVLAYTVAEQTQELGIRRALGAPGSSLIRLVLAQGLAPAVCGVALGAGGALGGQRPAACAAVRRLADGCRDVRGRDCDRARRGRARVSVADAARVDASVR